MLLTEISSIRTTSPTASAAQRMDALATFPLSLASDSVASVYPMLAMGYGQQTL